MLSAVKTVKSYATQRRFVSLFKMYLDPFSMSDECVIALGSPSESYPSNLIVKTTGSKYLFNCGAGTIRNIISQGSLLRSQSEKKHVFLTSNKWHNISGLPSYCAAVNASFKNPVESLLVHLPSSPDTKNLREFWRTCAFKSSANYNVVEEDQQFIEDKFEINIISLSPNNKASSTLLAYYCRIRNDLYRKLDPAICKDLKIPIGPWLKELKRGRDVTLDDGRLILANDVCISDRANKEFLIIECTSYEEFEMLRNKPVLNKPVDFIVHFTETDMVHQAYYKSWMDSFGPSCSHLLFNDKSFVNPIHTNTFEHYYALKKLDPVIYQPLYVEKRLNEMQAVSSNMVEQENIIYMSNYDVYDLYNGFTRSDRTIESEFLYDKLIENYDNYDEEFNALKEKQASFPESQWYEPEVIFLGTGGAQAAKYRCQPCILINLPSQENASFMFDCGESAYQQLLRYYGPKKTQDVLNNLKMIFVSHRHLDHICGLAEIVNERSKITDEPLVLLVPPDLQPLIDYCCQNVFKSNYKDKLNVFHINSISGWNREKDHKGKKKELIYNCLDNLVTEIDLFTAHHCLNSYAVAVTFNIGHKDMDNFTIAYSGDSRPVVKFLTVERPIDFLIHEASFGCGESFHALTKKHSTSVEGTIIGDLCKAKQTVLTHFSSRYNKVPPIITSQKILAAYANDFTKIKCPSGYQRLNLLSPFYEKLFNQKYGELRHSSNDAKNKDDQMSI